MSTGSFLLLSSMTLHTIAALSWVGSLLFTALVLGLPREALALDRRLMLLQRARWVLAAGLIVIWGTGIWNTMYSPAIRPPRGATSPLGLVPSVTTWDQLQELKETPYGYALYIKHLLIVVSMGVAALTHGALQTRLTRAVAPVAAAPLGGPVVAVAGLSPPKDGETTGLRRLMLWLALANVGLGVLIVGCAVYMVYTLH